MTIQSDSILARPKCSACGSFALRAENGFIVCTECGTCQDRDMVQSVYTIKEDGYQGPTQYTDIGLKMHIANSHGSMIGNKSDRQSIIRTSKFLRMKRAHNQIMMQIEERLYRGLKRINAAAAQLQLPYQTRDRAAYLLRKTLPHYKRPQSALQIVVLVFAVREHQLPITENDVKELIPIRSRHKHELNRAKFFLMNLLETKWPTSKPEWFIPKVINGISKHPKVLERFERRYALSDSDIQEYFNRLERLATILIQGMSSLDYGGRYASAIAASAIYTIDTLLLHVTSQKTVGEAINVTENTVRDHFNNFWKNKLPMVEVLLRRRSR